MRAALLGCRKTSGSQNVGDRGVMLDSWEGRYHECQD